MDLLQLRLEFRAVGVHFGPDKQSLAGIAGISFGGLDQSFYFGVHNVNARPGGKRPLGLLVMANQNSRSAAFNLGAIVYHPYRSFAVCEVGESPTERGRNF